MHKDIIDASVMMLDEYLKGSDMLVSTKGFLLKLREVLTQAPLTEEEITMKAPPQVIISCDASIKQNPGGPSSVGVVIEFPGKKPLEIAQFTPSVTNNQAEYDAVYTGLTSLMNLSNNPRMPIVVRSDSMLVIKQLNGEMESHDEKLSRKRDMILELVSVLPVPVKFEWRPRNSTQSLTQANYLAQDILGVPRH